MIRNEADLARTPPARARPALSPGGHRGRDALVWTGPTGTNVNDLRVALVGDP